MRRDYDALLTLLFCVAGRQDKTAHAMKRWITAFGGRLDEYMAEDTTHVVSESDW